MRCAAYHIAVLSFFLCSGPYADAQQEARGVAAPFSLTRTLSADIVDFTVDNLGNIYVLNKDNQLKKESPQGDSLAVFNDVRRYGKIASVDVTNPLKILVYYREFSTIIEL